MRVANTIYIGDTDIRVLMTRGRNPRRWGSVPLEPGLVRDGLILDEKVVADKVKEVCQSYGIGSGRIIAGISGINCLYRLISLPALPKELLAEAVEREAGRVLGVSMEQLYLSWQTMSSLPDETLVYLAAAPKDTVDALISTLRRAGFNPYLMDLVPLALARTITEPRAIVVDVQPASFDIVIVTEGMPQVVRSVPLGGAAGSLEGKVSLVREELNRAITFYDSGHGDKLLDASVPILVSGELAGREDVWEMLASGQERSVRGLPSPMETPDGFPAEWYMANIGLALKEVMAAEKGAIEYSEINFNALPLRFIPRKRPLSEFLLIPTIIVGIALVVFAAFTVMGTSAQTSALRAELASLNQRAIAQGIQPQTIIELNNKVSALEASAGSFAATFDMFEGRRDELNGDLAEINKALSVGGVDLEKVNHDGDTAVVSGLADGENAVLRYARSLRSSGRFDLVVTSAVHLEEEGRMGFIITLTKEEAEPL